MERIREQIRKYRLPIGLLKETEKILKDYSDQDPPNQGMVYWGGVAAIDCFDIKLLFAPKTESDERRVVIDQRENSWFVSTLNTLKLKHIAQIHTHPGTAIDHSQADDELAAFRAPGLLSIVVPSYGHSGMLPLTICGFHRYDRWGFIRLTDRYVQDYFEIFDSKDYIVIDRRNGNELGKN